MTRWLEIATRGTVLLLVTFVELLNRALWIKGACNGMYQIQTSLSLLLARSRVNWLTCFGVSKEKKHPNIYIYMYLRRIFSIVLEYSLFAVFCMKFVEQRVVEAPKLSFLKHT